MGKTITIAPVTRLEGHAKITINLDDAGNVKDTYVHIVELRGFEKPPGTAVTGWIDFPDTMLRIRAAR